MGDSHDPEDHTLYGSDHFPIVAEFEISLKLPRDKTKLLI